MPPPSPSTLRPLRLGQPTVTLGSAFSLRPLPPPAPLPLPGVTAPQTPALACRAHALPLDGCLMNCSLFPVLLLSGVTLGSVFETPGPWAPHSPGTESIHTHGSPTPHCGGHAPAPRTTSMYEAVPPAIWAETGQKEPGASPCCRAQESTCPGLCYLVSGTGLRRSPRPSRGALSTHKT